MAKETDADAVWAAVIAAEDAHGERAEDYALGEARQAEALGDMAQHAIWEAAAKSLHVLHSINRRWARPRDIPAPGADPYAGEDGG